MTNKLIFLDIDGTLTPAGSNVPPKSAIDAIRAAQKKGNKVFLCTGRNMAMLSPLLKYGFDGVVSCAGGYVVCDSKVIFDCPMTDEQKEKALDVLLKNGIFRTVESLDATYGDEGLSDILFSGEGNSEIERWRKALAENLGILPINQYDGRAVYKIVFMCKDKSQLEEPMKLLGDDFNFCMQTVASHSCINGEIINRKFNKGTAIVKICKALGVSIQDTYGFGDSMNDMEMMEVVGTSVSMDNATEKLKQISDMVCPSVENDGIAVAFEELSLV